MKVNSQVEKSETKVFLTLELNILEVEYLTDLLGKTSDIHCLSLYDELSSISSVYGDGLFCNADTFNQFSAYWILQK